jgi:hypothetical protein
VFLRKYLLIYQNILFLLCILTILSLLITCDTCTNIVTVDGSSCQTDTACQHAPLVSILSLPLPRIIYSYHNGFAQIIDWFLGQLMDSSVSILCILILRKTAFRMLNNRHDWQGQSNSRFCIFLPSSSLNLYFLNLVCRKSNLTFSFALQWNIH